MGVPRFRVCAKDFEEMLSVECLYFEQDGTLKRVDVHGGVIYRDVADIVLMQSTGLKDRDGVEIFEGDVIDGDGRDSHGVVEWCAEYGRWEVFDDMLSIETQWSRAKIIGNLYQHPHLIGAE